MKEILHQRMFESGFYKSLPKHVALYKALEASMEHANRDEFLAKKDKSRKRRRDDQDHPPPSPDLYLSKKKRHDSDASGSKQAPGKLLTLEKLLPAPLKDTDTAHLPKIKTRPNWLKPVPEEDRPETPKPDWIIPPNDLPYVENNWANALAKSYKDPKKNRLLNKTGDMGSFIKWCCKRIGKKKLTKADLEGPAYMTDLEYLVTGSKERGSAMSISKLKAANYPDFGLEELVPLLWIESERDYDISAAYGISHWWFKLSKLRAVIYRDRNDQKKMMRETEVHKFSDGTLNRILDKLDHMVKDFKLFKYNLGMETRIWSEDDRRRINQEVIDHVNTFANKHVLTPKIYVKPVKHGAINSP
ncbi:hypothetical protein Tco_0711404 [Tanacetum coccineum]